MLSYYAKAIVSLVISLGIVVTQAVSGVYDGGITGIEWLGIAAVVFGPAGLVAAFANTPWSPATKLLVQHVCTVAIVGIQGVIGVYDNGITGTEWYGVAAALLASLAVYFVPNGGTAAGKTTVVARA